MDQETIASDIGKIFREKLNIQVDDPTMDLFDSGLVDSLAFVDLVAALETEFDTQIDLLDVDLEDFQSIQAIAGFVAKRKTAGS